MRPIDLNAASFQELQTLVGLDKERAKSLMRYRAEHGRLRGWEDLQQVPGFDFESIGRVREQGGSLPEKGSGRPGR